MCPWCIVGYKKLQQAITRFDNLDVTLEWHPFELNPNMGPEGQHLGEHIAEKYGSTPEQSQQNRQRLTQIGKSLDFDFNFTDTSTIVNSFKAHQLLYWSKQFNKQTELKLALFDAYFTQQQNVDHNDVLIAVADSVGLDTAEATNILETNRFATEVKEEESLWMSRGIQAVPAIVFNQQYLVSGAQEADAIAELITKLISEQQ